MRAVFQKGKLEFKFFYKLCDVRAFKLFCSRCQLQKEWLAMKHFRPQGPSFWEARDMFSYKSLQAWIKCGFQHSTCTCSINFRNQHCFQGSYPCSETNFQDFSRTQIDFSRVLKFILIPTLPRSQC